MIYSNPNIVISEAIEQKLNQKHGVTRREVEQCFDNRNGHLLEDKREEHKTNPPTLWFIAKTNKDRLLKIVFVRREGKYFLKSAFEPNSDELRIYNNFG